MTYVALIREENERFNEAHDGPVRKTGLRALHEAAARRLKGER